MRQVKHTPAPPRLNRRDGERTSACTSAVCLRPCALRPVRPSYFAAFVSIGPASLFGASSLVLLSDPVREKRQWGMRTREAAHTWRAHDGVARTNGKETHPDLGVFYSAETIFYHRCIVGHPTKSPREIATIPVAVHLPWVRLPWVHLAW